MPAERIRILTVCLAALLLASCLQPAKKEVPVFQTDLKPEQFAGEIQRLETVAQSHPDAALRIAAHLQLAVLLASYRNPSVDYPRAFKEIEAYIALDPAGGTRDEIRNWRAILKRLVELSAEITALRSSGAQTLEENESLKQRIEQIKKENRELKATVDSLNKLDLQIEDKRKKIK